jgi:hypothetical protein
MAATVIIPIPSQDTSSVNLRYNQPFEFQVSAACNVCFSVNKIFPAGLSGKSFSPKANDVLGPFNAPNQDASINFNVEPPAQQCTVNRRETVRTIHVTSTGVK